MTAAAVGMIANLAVFFAGRVLFPEGVSLSGLDLFALVAAAGSFAVLQRFRVPISTRWCLSAPCWALLARDPQTLAVGQQQRASVARALALEPEVLLMDEPTSALDGAARRTIEDLVLGLYAGLGLTMILVGHDLSQVGREADRVLLVSEGRSVGEWPRDEFFSFGGERALRLVSEGP